MQAPTRIEHDSCCDRHLFFTVRVSPVQPGWTSESLSAAQRRHAIAARACGPSGIEQLYARWQSFSMTLSGVARERTHKTYIRTQPHTHTRSHTCIQHDIHMCRCEGRARFSHRTVRASLFTEPRPSGNTPLGTQHETLVSMSDRKKITLCGPSSSRGSAR